MAQEEAPLSVGINNTSLDFGFFLFNPTFSDLKIRIGDEEISAHKIVLCKRSQYFTDILLENPRKEELYFQDVSVNVLKQLLKFLYTDILSFDLLDSNNVAEFIKIGKKFSILSLESELIKNLKEYLTVQTCCQCLNASIDSAMENLTGEILTFMDRNVDELLNGDLLNNLSQEAMVRLLSRDNFVASEVDIFKCVKKWCQLNKDHDHLVGNCIKLSRFTKKELLEVGRSDYIDRNTFVNLLLKMEDGSFVVEGREIRNQNLACSDFGAKVVSGEDTETLLSDNNLDYAWHYIDNTSSITIELKTAFAFNHIQLGLWDNYIHSCSYYIEVSQENKNWHKVIDYSNFYCHSHQNLFFEKIVAKFVKIVGTKNLCFGVDTFGLKFVKIYLVDEIPQVVSGVIRPIENVATTGKRAFVIAPYNRDLLLNGDKTQSCCKYTSHDVESGSIEIKLVQPFLISSARLLLRRGYRYRYLVETSFNMTEWQVAVDKTNEDCENWQNLEFDERVVILIRITGTKSNSSNLALNSRNSVVFTLSARQVLTKITHNDPKNEQNL